MHYLKAETREFGINMIQREQFTSGQGMLQTIGNSSHALVMSSNVRSICVDCYSCLSVISRWKNGEAANMGHCWPRKVSKKM